MRSRLRPIVVVLGLSIATGVLLGGCKPDAAVTPTEEQRFKNPPTQIPPEAIKIMREHSGGPPAGAVPPAK
jgi:hypothetical protein